MLDMDIYAYEHQKTVLFYQTELSRGVGPRTEYNAQSDLKRTHNLRHRLKRNGVENSIRINYIFQYILMTSFESLFFI